MVRAVQPLPPRTDRTSRAERVRRQERPREALRRATDCAERLKQLGDLKGEAKARWSPKMGEFGERERSPDNWIGFTWWFSGNHQFLLLLLFKNEPAVLFIILFFFFSLWGGGGGVDENESKSDNIEVTQMWAKYTNRNNTNKQKRNNQREN